MKFVFLSICALEDQTMQEEKQLNKGLGNGHWPWPWPSDEEHPVVVLHTHNGHYQTWSMEVGPHSLQLAQ